MFELGCHVIDSLVYVLGKPQKVTPFARRTHTESDTLADNQLAVFEYPAAVATVRSALIEPSGEQRRQFVVCGEEGVIDIRPLEPPRMSLTLKQARGKYAKGQQIVDLPKPARPLRRRVPGPRRDHPRREGRRFHPRP